MSEIRKVNGICVTECVTFPRSGHHALLNVLQHYYGERLAYCEQYVCDACRIDVCPDTNYQKNHDFDLSTEIKQDRKYLIQIRDPLNALPSLWNFDRREGKDVVDWASWATEKARYWNGFFTKWVVNPVPNRLVVRYSDLITTSFEVITNVIEFMDGDGHTDAERLREALELFPIRSRRRKELPEILVA